MDWGPDVPSDSALSPQRHHPGTPLTMTETCRVLRGWRRRGDVHEALPLTDYQGVRGRSSEREGGPEGSYIPRSWPRVGRADTGPAPASAAPPPSPRSPAGCPILPCPRREEGRVALIGGFKSSKRTLRNKPEEPGRGGGILGPENGPVGWEGGWTR